MVSVLAGIMAVPAGMYFATLTEAPLAIIGAAVIFLPLSVFVPKLLREAREVNAGAVIEAFGKNEHAKRVFWTLFLVQRVHKNPKDEKNSEEFFEPLAGLVLTRIADPATAQKVIGVLTGTG